MHAPEGAPAAPIHPLLRYLRTGINPLPLAVGQKEPYLALVAHWKPLQRERVSEAQVALWINAGDRNMGVGLVCGKISDLCNLDADLDDLAAWILEHPDHPVLAGTWIVETGSGKAHVWVRSLNVPKVHAWYLRPDGARCGEVRGEGSYAAAPPSLHPSGGTYRTRSGSPESMAYVEDPDELARQITAAYLADNPGSAPTPPADRSYRFHTPDREQQNEIASRVKSARFTRKVTETLLKPGEQTPGQGHWVGASSHSEIDYHVVAAMVRKGWERDEAEWVFAGTLLADNCYANKQRRGSIGRAYWVTTWGNAEAEVRRSKAASLVATGSNFKVLAVKRVGARERTYIIDLQFTRPDGSLHDGQISLPFSELATPDAWLKVCIGEMEEVPRWLSNQVGRDFPQFTAAVLRMAEDTLTLPRDATDSGFREGRLLDRIRNLADHPPATRDALAVGWREGGVYFLRARDLIQAIRSYEHSFRPSMLSSVLMRMGTCSTIHYAFPDGETVELLKLRLRPGPDVPSDAASPPDADDDGS